MTPRPPGPLVVGYHASHEQHSPSRLLAFTERAEAAGFGAISSSDHFDAEEVWLGSHCVQPQPSCPSDDLITGLL